MAMAIATERYRPGITPMMYPRRTPPLMPMKEESVSASPMAAPTIAKSMAQITPTRIR